MHLADDAKGVAFGAWHIVVMWWRVLRTSYLRFGFSGAFIMAAAIAFYSVICLGPLGILFVGALRLLLGPGSNAYRSIQEAVGELGVDAAQQIMPQVDGLLRNPDASVASIASLVALIWAGIRLFETVERSLTAIWPGRLLRGFLTRKAVAVLMMLVAGLLLASLVLINTFFAAARAWLAHYPELDSHILAQARPRFILAYEFLLSLVAFTLLYKFMPVQRVPTRVALVGAIAAAVSWHAASPIFTYMITRSHQYDQFYGGLAGVVVFSLWAFLGAEVMLFGGHFAVAYERIFLRGASPRDDDVFAEVPRKAAGAARDVYSSASASPPTPRSAPSTGGGGPLEAPINGVIIAGGTIDADFARAVGTDTKGLIPILGRASIEYVVDAMRALPNLSRLVIVGPAEAYRDHPVAARVDAVIEQGAHITANLVRAIEALGDEHRILLAVSDTPLLTKEALLSFLQACPPDADVCYPVTRREPTQQLFAERTWVFLPLREGWITHTCNLLFEPRVITENLEFIEEFVARRRSQWTAARTIGIGFLLRFGLSWYVPFLRYDMEEIARRMECIVGARQCKGIIVDHPAMALDIDKPTDVQFIEEYLRDRNEGD